MDLFDKLISEEFAEVDKKFLTEAFLFAQNNSQDPDTKLASMLIVDGKIMSRASNLFVGNSSTDPLLMRSQFKEIYRICPEQSLIASVARSAILKSYGATMYSTLLPCVDCSKLIVQAGISTVVTSAALNELARGRDETFAVVRKYVTDIFAKGNVAHRESAVQVNVPIIYRGTTYK